MKHLKKLRFFYSGLPVSRCMKNRGFTMLELMIAISILSLGIITMYSVFSNTIVMSYAVSQKLTAIYLAKEGVEIVKNVRDDNFVNGRNWNQNLEDCALGCRADYKTGTSIQGPQNAFQAYNNNEFLFLDSDGLYSYDAGSTTRFKRKITISSEGSNTVKITSEVFWDYNGKPYSFQTEDYLYDWY